MWSDNPSLRVSRRSVWCNSHKAVRPRNEHEWLVSQLKTAQDDFVLDLQDSNSPQSWKSSLFSQPCGTFSTAATSRNFRNCAQGERWDGLGKFLLPVKHLPLGENEKTPPLLCSSIVIHITSILREMPLWLLVYWVQWLCLPYLPSAMQPPLPS